MNKARRKIDYSQHKQNKQHKHRQNKNNKKKLEEKLWSLGLYYVGITLVVLVLRWLRWYHVGCVGITLALDIWLHILVILYFTSTLFSRCNALPKEVPNRIIQKEKTGQIRDEDVSFILSFIYVDEGVIPEYIEMVEYPN